MGNNGLCMFVNADMLFHFLGAFCDWGSFIALAVGFGFVALKLT